jgi:DNA (cytosine-5)-methyltransferase 1
LVTVGELFAGIGGFGLGLERAGMRVLWHSEIDRYASAVLRKHWPHVPNHGDIRNVRAGTVEPVDVLCGGFPCQDISSAGLRGGIERSGLWGEYARIIGDLGPRYVFVENVSALLGRGLDRVLGDLAALGFDAEWHCIPASAVGAPHRRDRVWIIGSRPGRAILADALRRRLAHSSAEPERVVSGAIDAPVGGSWRAEPDVGRVVDGIPARVDRLRCLGNAIVPQIAEAIGRAVMDME